ncbi:MAG: PAS domain S-box protein, partial [Burkholderiales bacterium PBB5]
MLDEQGDVVGHVGSVEDVTDRLQTRRALEKERRRLAAIIEGTDAGTWEWNVQTGAVQLNERSAAMLGYTLAELGVQTIQLRADYTHPEDHAKSIAAAKRHFAGELPLYESEARMRHRDGHWVWILARGRVLSRTADGKPEWMFGTHLDITARKAQEDRLRKSEELLNRTGALAQV